MACDHSKPKMILVTRYKLISQVFMLASLLIPRLVLGEADDDDDDGIRSTLLFLRHRRRHLQQSHDRDALYDTDEHSTFDVAITWIITICGVVFFGLIVLLLVCASCPCCPAYDDLCCTPNPRFGGKDDPTLINGAEIASCTSNNDEHEDDQNDSERSTEEHADNEPRNNDK